MSSGYLQLWPIGTQSTDGPNGIHILKVVYHRCWSLIFEIKILDVRLRPFQVLLVSIGHVVEAVERSPLNMNAK